MAGWMIMGGSVLVVATVFETITSLNTLETREAVSQFLSEPPGEGLGLDVSGALLVLRTVSMVAAGCAAVAAVLGFHVLRRNRSARLGVTVVAIPLFFTGMVTGGFLSSVVAASALLLWLEPARNWFDGVPAKRVFGASRRRLAAAHASVSRATALTSALPEQAPATAPRSQQGFGTAAAPSAVESGRPERRPAAVMWACVLTWVLSGTAAVMMALSALVIALQPDLVFEELRRQNPELGDQGLTDRAVQVATYVTAGVTVVVGPGGGGPGRVRPAAGGVGPDRPAGLRGRRRRRLPGGVAGLGADGAPRVRLRGDVFVAAAPGGAGVVRPPMIQCTHE